MTEGGGGGIRRGMARCVRARSRGERYGSQMLSEKESSHLEEDVHFPVRIFRASPDLHGAAVERQVVELVHLVLPNVDILKLSAL